MAREHKRQGPIKGLDSKVKKAIQEIVKEIHEEILESISDKMSQHGSLASHLDSDQPEEVFEIIETKLAELLGC